MAYPPFPPTEGGEPSDATRGAGVRLGDAAPKTADQMDINGEESLKDELKDETLKDAVADVVANGTQDEIERLTSRIGAAQAAYVGPNGEASSLPILAEPVKQTAAEPSEGALLGLREWSEARATVAAELAEVQSQPQTPQSEQHQAGGTHWRPATQQDAEPYQPEQEKPAEPVEVVTPEPAVVAELPPAVPLVAETVVAEAETEAAGEPLAAEPVAEPLAAEPVVPEPPASDSSASESEVPLPEPVSARSEDAAPEAPLAGMSLAGLSPAEHTSAEPGLAEPPRPQSLYARLEASLPEPPLPEASHPEPLRPQSLSARLGAPLPELPSPEPARPQLEASVTPIASALDAAVKLAADADAAAAALENLSRMLQAHQRPASIVPSPGQHAALRPMQPAARTGAPDSRPMHMPPRSVMPDGDPLQMATPRPEHRPMKRMMPRPAPVEVPTPRPVRPPSLRPAPVPPDARQFDLRGFMAGFAVAGALGALLYIYMIVG